MGRRSRRAIRHRARNWDLRRILTVAVAVAGVAVLLYPSAAAWFSDRSHAEQINAYVHQTQGLPEETRQAMLAEARSYNANLPGGPLRDPYTLDSDGSPSAVGGGTQAYRDVLAGLPGGVMARVQIPAIGVDLPVFHGTEEETLTNGVGHLFGSALPVGGTGTHSVLTTHSGLVDATLFTDLEKLAEGDVFSGTVLDEQLHYRVDEITTVKPSDTLALRPEPGKDRLTLVTCTPLGVNSHRLLVRGERIESPPTVEEDDVELGAGAPAPGFPWWALGVPVAAAAMVLLTRPHRSRSSATPSAEPSLR
ncbi:class C sortase [Arthrobacter gengyunqii]|uniref:Class C sortase n=1 Tax=Arthrobacter gengyunqii TaxID=2886940 RepID=A0ABS8GG52_9MICC|nr:class C sortase [Arthrobacter gengyunqii]MCC3265627.1 class C sortase [Arthrobacter gengyunqii]